MCTNFNIHTTRQMRVSSPHSKLASSVSRVNITVSATQAHAQHKLFTVINKHYIHVHSAAWLWTWKLGPGSAIKQCILSPLCSQMCVTGFRQKFLVNIVNIKVPPRVKVRIGGEGGQRPLQLLYNSFCLPREVHTVLSHITDKISVLNVFFG